MKVEQSLLGLARELCVAHGGHLTRYQWFPNYPCRECREEAYRRRETERSELHNRTHPCDGSASNSCAGNLVIKEPSNG